MLITIDETSIASLADHGSVVLVTGADTSGRMITFGAEPRMINDIAHAVMIEDEIVQVEIEPWQVMGVQE